MHPTNPDDLSATITALYAILDAVRQQARTDATLRGHLATLGQALCAIADAAAHDAALAPAAMPAGDLNAHRPVTDRPGEHATAPPTQVTSLALALAPVSPPASREDIERLQRAFQQGHRADTPATRSLLIRQAQDDTPDDTPLLSDLSSACAAKAARIRQHQAQEEMTPAAPHDRDLYWMDTLFAKAAIPTTDWDMLAGSYEVIAALIEALADVLDDPELARYKLSGLEYAAEALSALHAAVERIRPQPDPSQKEFFQWLRRRAKADTIFIKRYMRIEDHADPADWPARLGRIVQWRESVESTIYRLGHARKLLGTIRYQLRQVSSGDTQAWPQALQTIEALIAHGTPPSDRTLRGLLWPYRTTIMAERKHSQSMALVARELERAPRPPSKRPGADASNDRIEPHIAQVADLLHASTVVLIGADYRTQVARTIEDAFELRSLVWCDTHPHQSYLLLEPAIARPEVSVVLLAIRWASHGLGAVRTLCDEYQKPLVRLPGGYNVSQLAHQIIQQASDRLAARAADDRAEAA